MLTVIMLSPFRYTSSRPPRVGGGLDLLEEPRGTDDGRELRVHDLDGDFAIVARVVGEVYGGHAAGAQLALERVAVGHGFLQAMKRISHEGKIWTDYSFATAFNEPIAALASRPAPWPASIAPAPRRGRA